MNVADFTTNPVWDEWTMDVEASVGSSIAQDRLQARGYRLVEPVKESDDGVFTMLARSDGGGPASDAKRTNGKMMLAAAVGITLVLLVMMAENIGGERTVVPPLLLAAVILGGMGMNRLREPAKRRRGKLMEVTISPTPDGGCRVLAKGALIPDAAEEPAPPAERAASERGLLEDLRVADGKGKSREKRE